MVELEKSISSESEERIDTWINYCAYNFELYRQVSKKHDLERKLYSRMQIVIGAVVFLFSVLSIKLNSFDVLVLFLFNLFLFIKNSKRFLQIQ